MQWKRYKFLSQTTSLRLIKSIGKKQLLKFQERLSVIFLFKIPLLNFMIFQKANTQFRKRISNDSVSLSKKTTRSLNMTYACIHISCHVVLDCLSILKVDNPAFYQKGWWLQIVNCAIVQKTLISQNACAVLLFNLYYIKSYLEIHPICISSFQVYAYQHMLIYMLLLSTVESVLFTYIRIQIIRSTQLNHKPVLKIHVTHPIRTQLFSTVYRCHTWLKENLKVTFQKLIQVHGIMQDFSTVSAIKLGI